MALFYLALLHHVRSHSVQDSKTEMKGEKGCGGQDNLEPHCWEGLLRAQKSKVKREAVCALKDGAILASVQGNSL